MVGVLVLLVAVVPATSASATPAATVRNAAIGKLMAKLHDPAATIGDKFGDKVSVSIAVIGAPNTNSSAGAAYIYVKGASGWPKKPTATLADPGATSGDDFGTAVAVSGETVVVGADSPSNGPGAAYIYVEGSSGWSTRPTVTLVDPTATAGDYFGNSVAVSGKTVVVGADAALNGPGAAYIYVKGASGWPRRPTVALADPTATSGDSFGISVAVSGRTVVVCDATANSDRGAAYIYVRRASGWPNKPTATLANPAGKRYEYFGFSVAVSGSTIVVGDWPTPSGAGVAYIYVNGSSGWPTTPTVTLFDPKTAGGGSFGFSVAVSGTIAVVGALFANSHAGAAYIYVQRASGWPKKPAAALSDPHPMADDLFANSVAVSGSTAVVGAPVFGSVKAGAAYIYKA